MEEKQKQKLKRYFMNASKFLWGLSRRNQRETYKWLWEKGYNFQNGTYKYVIGQIVENPGIERIIKEIVLPEIKKQYSDGFLNDLHYKWNKGELPDLSFVDRHNIKDAEPFLEIRGDQRFRYVDRYGELAPIYFEEIEPWLEEQKSNGG